MENFSSNYFTNDLIRELEQGGDLTMRLKTRLNGQASSQESEQYLIQEIINSYDRSLSMLNHSSGGSDDHGSKSRRNKDKASVKKGGKKGVPKWTEKVEVNGERGDEAHVEDGYHWRKYGQKDIFGSRHPRSYYRCTYKNARGCLAKRQVQATDDPKVIEVTYKGLHTCGNNPAMVIKDPTTEFQASSSREICFGSSHAQTSPRATTQNFYVETDDRPSWSTMDPANSQVFPDWNAASGDYSTDFMFQGAAGSSYFNGYGGGFVGNWGESESEFERIAASADSLAFGIDFPSGNSWESGSDYRSGFFP